MPHLVIGIADKMRIVLVPMLAFLREGSPLRLGDLDVVMWSLHFEVVDNADTVRLFVEHWLLLYRNTIVDLGPGATCVEN